MFMIVLWSNVPNICDGIPKQSCPLPYQLQKPVIELPYDAVFCVKRLSSNKQWEVRKS